MTTRAGLHTIFAFLFFYLMCTTPTLPLITVIWWFCKFYLWMEILWYYILHGFWFTTMLLLYLLILYCLITVWFFKLILVNIFLIYFCCVWFWIGFARMNITTLLGCLNCNWVMLFDITVYWKVFWLFR